MRLSRKLRVLTRRARLRTAPARPHRHGRGLTAAHWLGCGGEPGCSKPRPGCAHLPAWASSSEQRNLERAQRFSTAAARGRRARRPSAVGLCRKGFRLRVRDEQVRESRRPQGSPLTVAALTNTQQTPKEKEAQHVNRQPLKKEPQSCGALEPGALGGSSQHGRT